MNKKLKRSIVSLLLFLGVIGVTAFANPMKHSMFMGEVLKVQKCDQTKEVKLLVCGYLKGCEVSKTQMVIICDKNTDIQDACNKKEKVAEVKEGDMICVALDKKITKSIPPQALAKKITVTKANSCKREEEKTNSNDSVRVEKEKQEAPKADEKKVEAPKAEEKPSEKKVEAPKATEKATEKSELK